VNQKTAIDRLDDAIKQLESHIDNYEGLLRGFEDAESAYEVEYLKAWAHAAGSVDARKNTAKQYCYDLGVDGALRAARVRLKAAESRARTIDKILDGLRTLASSQRVGIQ